MSECRPGVWLAATRSQWFAAESWLVTRPGDNNQTQIQLQVEVQIQIQIKIQIQIQISIKIQTFSGGGGVRLLVGDARRPAQH